MKVIGSAKTPTPASVPSNLSSLLGRWTGFVALIAVLMTAETWPAVPCVQGTPISLIHRNIAVSEVLNESKPLQDKLFKLKGYIYDKDNQLVDRITLTVSNSEGYRRTLAVDGRFVLMLPAGNYNFKMRDSIGHEHNYRNMDVSSDTSIKFMFAKYKRASNPVVSFSASSNAINVGESTTLSWSTGGAESVRISGGIGPVSASGSRRVSPTSTRTYEITASNTGGTTRQSITVSVARSGSDAPTVTFTSRPQSVRAGQKVTLTWTTSGADSVRIDPGIGEVANSGSRTFTPSRSGKYTLTAVNSAGATTQGLSIGVAAGPDVNPTPEPPLSPPDTGGPVVVGPSEPEPEPSEETPAPTPTVVQPKVTETTDLSGAGGGESPGFFSTTPGKITFWTLLTLLFAGLIWGAWMYLPFLIPLAGSLLGLLGLAGSTGEGDEVHCTLYSQPEVSAGSDVMVQVFAHLLEQAEELDELAAELDPDVQRQMSKALKKKIKRESVLTFKLMVPGIELDEEEQDIVWRGEPESVEFIIPIPGEHAAGKRFGRVYVYNNGEEIGKIPFRLSIMPAALQLDTKDVPPHVGGVMTQNECAFVSYSSRDKEKVYRFVQLMDVLKYKYHIDIFHIDAGDRWEQKLYEFIEKDDVFLLFWSDSASKSQWVLKEAEMAKKRMDSNPKGLPRMIIYNLGGEAPVPEWLQDIHVDRKWAEIIGKIEAEQ